MVALTIVFVHHTQDSPTVLQYYMALKPISLNLLEDTFVCQCRYVSDDVRYADYLDDKDAKKREVKLSPRLSKAVTKPNVRAKA